MNLPNKLTLLRVLVIPVLVVIYYLKFPYYDFVIGFLFVAAAFTDLFDGYLARKHNLVTTLGKFLDPLADKLLVMFALLMLQDVGVIPMWVVLVVLSREFIVTGIRLVAAGDGSVIAAGVLGKYKTTFTMIALGVLLFIWHDASIFRHENFPWLGFTIPWFASFAEWVGYIMLYLGVALTVVSGIEYYIRNKHVFKQQ